MDEKADITLSRDQAGRLLVKPDPFVLPTGATRIRIRNDSDTDLELDLKEAPVEEDVVRMAARALESITLKRSVAEGRYGYEVRVAPAARRGAAAEGSPKIIVEASPKIIVEASPKIIAEGSPKIITERSS
jgi:hypothetical protein